MQIEIFTLCEAATQSVDGKLNILGAFDVIQSPELPVVHPQCAVALRLRLDKIEQGHHSLRIAIVDLDGKAILPNLDGGFDPKFNGDQSSVVANLILGIQRLKIEKYGEYAIDLAINGKRERSLPLIVRQLR